MFSTFLECSQKSGVFYHSVIHGVGFFIYFIIEVLLGGGAHVPCLNFTSSYVDISQVSFSPVGISSKRNCDIGVAFPISLE